MPATLFDAGGCACTADLVFRGCHGLALPNYRLDIYDHAGGTLLESITTSASGHATVATTGAVWIQSTDGRFSGQAFTLPVSPVNMTVLGAAYACRDSCAVPIDKTTFFTDVNGTWTLNYDGTNWVGCGISGNLPNVLTGLQASCLEIVGTGPLVYSISVGTNWRAVITWVKWPSFLHLGLSIAVSSFGSPYHTSGAGPTCTAGVLGWTVGAPCFAGSATLISLSSGATIFTCPPAMSNVGGFGAIGLITNPDVGAWVETE